MKNLSIGVILLFMVLSMNACNSHFTIRQLGKSDIDFVADAHRKETEQLLYQLLDKLYKRNPGELLKQQDPTIEAQTLRLQTAIKKSSPLIIDGLEGIDLLQQAFSPEFSGDRVFTLVGGLFSMIHKSYDYHVEFFILDQFDQQKLYNAARNIEIVSWRLRTAKDKYQQPLLLSSTLTGDSTNISFERLLSKLISLQDMMALIATDGNRRTINGVAQGLAKAAFFPI